MKTAIYPGSFDPITKGHLDVLETGSKIFGKVIIAVSHNINKKSFLTVEERIKLIKESVKHLPNVPQDHESFQKDHTFLPLCWRSDCRYKPDITLLF